MSDDVLAPNRLDRLHVNLGFTCNNNCWFCMEEDRERREENLRGQTDDDVRQMLIRHRACGEVMFTSGEPTLHPRLPTYVGWARKLGYPTIGLITNGRRLGYEPYARELLSRGLNHVVVSLHGHTARLHELLTRTPGSFAQTRDGVAMLARLSDQFPLKLHTSTVLNKRNAPHLRAIYHFLKELGVLQVVFNTIQASGRGATHFKSLFPRYSELAAAFGAFLAAEGREVSDAFLLDVPYCITEALPAINRGFVERRVHYEPTAEAAPGGTSDRGGDDPLQRYHTVDRDDLNDLFKSKRPECARCRHVTYCDGVFKAYTEAFGWDEFVPVEQGL